MPDVTLYGWHSRGLIKTKRVNGQWVAVADKDELRRLRRVRRQHMSHRERNASAALLRCELHASTLSAMRIVRPTCGQRGRGARDLSSVHLHRT